MNTIKTFTNENLGSVRTLLINGEPYFVGKDVAHALGYTDINHTILDHVDEEDRVNSKTQGQNDPELGQRGSWLINEAGLYCLILSSKLPSAKAFKRWVTNEILPSIRKNGGYIEGQEHLSAEEKEKLEAEVRKLHSKVNKLNEQNKDLKGKVKNLVKIIEHDYSGDFDKKRCEDPQSDVSVYDAYAEDHDDFQEDTTFFNVSEYFLFEEVKAIINAAESTHIDNAAAKHLIGEMDRLFAERSAV